MADLPITFSGPMVRALLDGRKTQTRRILKPRGADLWQHATTGEWFERHGVHGSTSSPVKAPYAPGDRLWVKEAWRTGRAYDDLSPSEMSGEEPIQYEAGPIRLPLQDGRYRHARFMPRWASRLTLIVTDVRVERLQDISEEDAIAEGMTQETADAFMCPEELAVFASAHILCPDSMARIMFETYWDRMHGRGAWDRNPRVAVYGFQPVLANIDALEG